MTATTHVTLWCDGADCSEWTDHGSSRIRETRELAHREGWGTDYVDDRGVSRLVDLCPFHVRYGAAQRGRYHVSDRPTVEELEDQHEPMEATGGYIECSCGWPTKQQWEAGMSFVRHILDEVAVDSNDQPLNRDQPKGREGTAP